MLGLAWLLASLQGREYGSNAREAAGGWRWRANRQRAGHAKKSGDAGLVDCEKNEVSQKDTPLRYYYVVGPAS